MVKKAEVGADVGTLVGDGEPVDAAEVSCAEGVCFGDDAGALEGFGGLVGVVGEPEVGGASCGETGAKVEKLGENIPVTADVEVNGPAEGGECLCESVANGGCFLFLAVSSLSPYIALDRCHFTSLH